MGNLLFVLWIYWPFEWAIGHAVISPGWFSMTVTDTRIECREEMERAADNAIFNHPGFAVICLPAGMEPEGRIAEAV